MKDYGIFAQCEQASPEAQLSMRMAELENLAKYRAERMARFADWVKPENIAARQKKHEEEAGEALARGLAMAAIAKQQMADAKLDKEMRKLPFTVKPVFHIIKKPWWRRLLEWFRP